MVKNPAEAFAKGGNSDEQFLLSSPIGYLFIIIPEHHRRVYCQKSQFFQDVIPDKCDKNHKLDVIYSPSCFFSGTVTIWTGVNPILYSTSSNLRPKLPSLWNAGKTFEQGEKASIN